MILTPIDADAVPLILDTFDRGLEHHEVARRAFRRIAVTRKFCPGFKADLNAGRAKAVDLAQRMNIPVIDGDPAEAFSWDGVAIRTRTETSVVFHEIAHWQISPPERRMIYDFGLGGGPESGRMEDANHVACADAATKEEEENLASLLGILWEAEYNEPAILAFAEQNWLEFPDRPHTVQHFITYVDKLMSRGLLDDDGRPVIPQAMP